MPRPPGGLVLPVNHRAPMDTPDSPAPAPSAPPPLAPTRRVKKTPGVFLLWVVLIGFLPSLLSLTLLSVLPPEKPAVYPRAAPLSSSTQVRSLDDLAAAAGAAMGEALGEGIGQVISDTMDAAVSGVGILLYAVFYLPALIIALVRRRWLFLLLGLAPGHMYIGYFLLHGRLTPVEFLALWAARKAAFLYFAMATRGRPGFMVFATLLVALLAGGWFLPLVFAITVFVARVVILALWQNLGVFADLGVKNSAKILGGTLLRWTPILLLIIPGTLINEWVRLSTIEQVYAHTFVKDSGFGLRQNIHLSLAHEFDQLSAGAGRRFDQLQAASNTDLAAIQQAAVDVYSQAFPEKLAALESSSPSWYELDEHIINSVKAALRSAYKAVRRGQIQLLRDNLATAHSAYAGQTRQFINHARSSVESALNPTRQTLHQAVDQAFRYVQISHFVSLLCFGFVMLKSFLYVFARVAFAAGTGAFVTLRDSPEPMLSGQVRKCGSRYVLEAGSPVGFFASRKFRPNGRAPKIALPQPASAFIGRISHGVWSMNHIVMGPGRGDVFFSALQGAEFVEWDLQPGEVVIFNFKHFVGMSQGVKLAPLISLRMGSLLFDRMIFSTATGPGKLLLMTQGTPATDDEPAGAASVCPSRILAWHKNARFNVESELSILDIYFSGVYLVRHETDPVLIDADGMGQPRTGLTRFVLSFLLPV